MRKGKLGLAGLALGASMFLGGCGVEKYVSNPFNGKKPIEMAYDFEEEGGEGRGTVVVPFESQEAIDKVKAGLVLWGKVVDGKATYLNNKRLIDYYSREMIGQESKVFTLERATDFYNKSLDANGRKFDEEVNKKAGKYLQDNRNRIIIKE